MNSIQKKLKVKHLQEQFTLGDEPTQVRCPYCNCDTLTIIDFTNGYNTYILSFVVLLLAGILISLFLIPIVFVITKTLIHKYLNQMQTNFISFYYELRCQHCDNEIGTNGKLIYGLNLKDDVISLKVGEIGCILTKKILSGVLLTLFAAAVLYYQITFGSITTYTHTHTHNDGITKFENSIFYNLHMLLNLIIKVIYINDTWIQFLDLCKLDKISQSLKNYEICKHTYLEKSFQNWQGYIIRIEDYRFSVKKFQHHAVSVLIKMEPPEFDNHADLLLTFDTDMVDHMNDLLDTLERGNEILFNATLKSLGSDHQTRHMHGVNIIKGLGFLDIPPHIHSNGRYSDKPRLIRGKLPQ